jgi:hypothetical protein
MYGSHRAWFCMRLRGLLGARRLCSGDGMIGHGDTIGDLLGELETQARGLPSPSWHPTMPSKPPPPGYLWRVAAVPDAWRDRRCEPPTPDAFENLAGVPCQGEGVAGMIGRYLKR